MQKLGLVLNFNEVLHYVIFYQNLKNLTDFYKSTTDVVKLGGSVQCALCTVHMHCAYREKLCQNTTYLNSFKFHTRDVVLDTIQLKEQNKGEAMF